MSKDPNFTLYNPFYKANAIISTPKIPAAPILTATRSPAFLAVAVVAVAAALVAAPVPLDVCTPVDVVPEPVDVVLTTTPVLEPDWTTSVAELSPV